MIRAAGFDAYMREAARSGRLVVQPRMGFSQAEAMRRGLCAVKYAAATMPRIGTVTIDAYTRVGQIDQATAALRAGRDLNGYPIVSHGPEATLRMLDGLRGADFPIQVRHGSAYPLAVFRASAEAGFDAIEGGPVSYNLPYSREPLKKTVAAWAEAAGFWAVHGRQLGFPAHLETFGGSMLGQLCPPGLLVALSVLEALFFAEQGVESLSLSLAQGTCEAQDIGALLALSDLARRYLPDVSWHIVFYTFMGLFPRTAKGAEALIRSSARIAVAGGAHRLIVKTVAEARGIPTVQQNVTALRWCRETADGGTVEPGEAAGQWAATIAEEAECLISATRSLAPSIGDALVAAFAAGLLDVPYCPHPDNRNVARPALEPATGALVWADSGALPIPSASVDRSGARLDAEQFHTMLELNRSRYEQLDTEDSKEAHHD